MTKKQLLTKFALLAASACAFNANAASPATATFQVKMTIQKTCSVTAGSTSDINLGTVDTSATNISGTNSFTVKCSKTTPYFIGLAPSNASITGAGVMSGTGTNTDTVPYQLYSNSGLSLVWGNTATSTLVGNGVAGTGSGGNQTINVWAEAASANYTPDSYSDTVTINVNY
jgi:spore coat protein U domain-containing protein, fimbrial subunit CupE1/2/3/6